MGAFGIMRDVVIRGAVAMVRVHMSGITRKPFHIFFLRWNERFVILSFAKIKGVIEEPHHNTYDIEFWGPDGMCTSFYLGALMAIIEMGKFLKKSKDVAAYQKLYENGKRLIESELYNGEYFYQKIQVDGLNAPNPIQASEKSMGGQYSDEARALLEKEGPKYQYGAGCLSDGVLGAWIAKVSGLNDPFDRNKITSHL